MIANRITARIVNGEETVEATIDGAYFVENHKTVYLVMRRREQEDLFDDDGNLLNDETPSGIHENLRELEKLGVDYSTPPIEIEIWFSDGEDDIQYRLECHQYYVSNERLAVIHFLGREEDEDKDEFINFLHEQY